MYERAALPSFGRSPVVYGVVFAVALTAAAVLLNIGPTLLLLSLSILPVLILLLWVVRTDRYEPEPKSLVVSLMCVGAVVGGLYVHVPWPSGFAAYLLTSILVEAVFFAVLYLLDANRVTGREMNDHMDGAVYGLALGLGYVAYVNFTQLWGSQALLATGLAALLSIEALFRAVFPALTGWWIGYVKAKYVSIGLAALVPGLVSTAVLKLVYELVSTGLSLSALPIRAAAITVVGLFFLLMLVRRVRWAVRDQLLWGYATGLAPVEKR